MTTSAAEKLRAALEMADVGIELMRQNLRRAHPKADDDHIDRLLRNWIDGRPPDCPGSPRRLSDT